MLSNNDVDITGGDVSILENVLNDNNVVLTDLVAVGILSTDDIIIFV